MTDQTKPEDGAPDAQPAGKPSAAPAQPAANAKTPGSGPQGHGAEELPYIDDPVSKWWIAIIIAVFALIFAWAIFFGAGGLLGGILDSDEPAASPEPTLVASPAATEVPTVAPEVTPEPELTQVPTVAPEPTALPTAEPQPTATATPEPASTGAPATSDEPVASPGG